MEGVATYSEGIAGLRGAAATTMPQVWEQGVEVRSGSLNLVKRNQVVEA